MEKGGFPDIHNKLEILWRKIQKITCISGFPFCAEIIITFILGFVFSPWSKGIAWVIGLLLIYEIFFACAYEIKHPWNLENRILLLLVYILAWILGRIFAGINPPI